MTGVSADRLTCWVLVAMLTLPSWVCGEKGVHMVDVCGLGGCFDRCKLTFLWRHTQPIVRVCVCACVCVSQQLFGCVRGPWQQLCVCVCVYLFLPCYSLWFLTLTDVFWGFFGGGCCFSSHGTAWYCKTARSASSVLSKPPRGIIIMSWTVICLCLLPFPGIAIENTVMYMDWLIICYA